jgi:hypothetical protein
MVSTMKDRVRDAYVARGGTLPTPAMA